MAGLPRPKLNAGYPLGPNGLPANAPLNYSGVQLPVGGWIQSNAQMRPGLRVNVPKPAKVKPTVKQPYPMVQQGLNPQINAQWGANSVQPVHPAAGRSQFAQNPWGAGAYSPLPYQPQPEGVAADPMTPQMPVQPSQPVPAPYGPQTLAPAILPWHESPGPLDPRTHGSVSYGLPEASPQAYSDLVYRPAQDRPVLQDNLYRHGKDNVAIEFLNNAGQAVFHGVNQAVGGLSGMAQQAMDSPAGQAAWHGLDRGLQAVPGMVQGAQSMMSQGPQTNAFGFGPKMTTTTVPEAVAQLTELGNRVLGPDPFQRPQPFNFDTAAAQLPQMAQQAASGLPPVAPPQPVAMAPPMPQDTSSAAQPVGSVAYQQQVYNNARQQVLDQLAAPIYADNARLEQGLASLKPYGQAQQPSIPTGPTGVPSGLGTQLNRGMPAMYGANDAAVGDFRMGPRVGTEGLGALPNYDAMNQVANAQQRAKYEAFMDAAKAAGKSYAAGWNPETNRNEKQKLTRNDTRSSEYAIEQNSARHQKLGDEQRLAQRAAVYGRHYGIPPAMATAGIQGMNALAENPNYGPTEIQRMGMGLPPAQQPELSPEFVAWSNARTAYLNSGLPPESMASAIGSQPPVYVTPGVSSNAGLPKPAPQPGVAAGLTEPERKSQIAAQSAGDSAAAAQIASRRTAIEELRGSGRVPEDILVALENANTSAARNLLISYLGDTPEAHQYWQRISGVKGEYIGPNGRAAAARPSTSAPFYGFMPVN